MKKNRITQRAKTEESKKKKRNCGKEQHTYCKDQKCKIEKSYLFDSKRTN